MWKQKIALGVSSSFGLDFNEQIKLFAEIGFDGIFFEWQIGSPIDSWINCARQHGLYVQSIHAPFRNAHVFWGNDEQLAQMAIDEQKQCIDVCSKNNVEIMVVHAFKGFKDHSPNTEGLNRFAQVIDYAKKNNVKIAFENTEGEEYLQALMHRFENDTHVGFCWDSGHEMCYNHSKDMLALYGDRLLATHINDNLGIKDFNGEITYLDDLHLLPYDGIADWDHNVNRLKKHGCPEFLTLELTICSKKGRYDNDIYAKMDIKDYLSECYKRACKIASRIAY